MKTVKDMKCGFCGTIGHTARTCEEKKRSAIKEERTARRKQAKKYFYSESKEVIPLIDKLTEEGKTALLNNGFMRSAHFMVQTKPETAIQETLVEPLFEELKRRASHEDDRQQKQILGLHAEHIIQRSQRPYQMVD